MQHTKTHTSHTHTRPHDKKRCALTSGGHTKADTKTHSTYTIVRCAQRVLTVIHWHHTLIHAKKGKHTHTNVHMYTVQASVPNAESRGWKAYSSLCECWRNVHKTGTIVLYAQKSAKEIQKNMHILYVHQICFSRAYKPGLRKHMYKYAKKKVFIYTATSTHTFRSSKSVSKKYVVWRCTEHGAVHRKSAVVPHQ